MKLSSEPLAPRGGAKIISLLEERAVADWREEESAPSLMSVRTEPGKGCRYCFLIPASEPGKTSASSHSRSRSSESGEEMGHHSSGDWRQYVPNNWRGRFGF